LEKNGKLSNFEGDIDDYFGDEKANSITTRNELSEKLNQYINEEFLGKSQLLTFYGIQVIAEQSKHLST
jgi:predicted XRE-type DNA-binding protein